VREAFGDGLGYREEDRIVQVTRVQRIAKLLADQDLIVIVALVYANVSLLDWNRGYKMFLKKVYTNPFYKRQISVELSEWEASVGLRT